jgi:hypothetical protein
VTVAIANGRGKFQRNLIELTIEVRGDRVSVSLSVVNDMGNPTNGDLKGKVSGSVIEATGTVKQSFGYGNFVCTLRLTKQ